jgi:hypothetical protein
MKRIAIVFALSLATGGVAHADKPLPEARVAHGRVHLGDVVEGAPEALAGIDLGPSPLPGSSRVIKRDEVEHAVPQGLPARLKVPAAVRVVRRTKTLGTTELETETRRALQGVDIGRGAVLTAARPSASVTIPDGFDAITADVPRPPRRSGKMSTIATLTFHEGDSDLAKVQVPIDIELPKSAAQADVGKGAKVIYVISRGALEIRAMGTSGADGDVGDEIPLTISESGKVLRGKIVRRDPATVVEAP